MILFFNPYFSNFVKFNVYEWVFYIFLKDRKLARNASCLTHATGAIVLNGMNIMWPSTRIFSLCKHWSTGYFLYDMYFMLMYEKMDKVRLAYMYHHLASCFILQYPPELYYGDRMLFWGELSNIPSYFVYHYLRVAPASQKLQRWKKVQKIVYGGIRVPILTWLTMTLWYKAPSKLPLLFVTPVYFMGLAWTMKLLKK
mgnify:FL=1|jgi:hypothetical protein